MGIEIDCVVRSGSRIGEAPFWDSEDGVLWWVDIPAGLIHRYDPAGGDNRSLAFGEPVGSVAPCASGELVVAAKTGLYLLDPDTGRRRAIVDPEAHLPGNRFNDGITDPRGRFWAGTMKDGTPRERTGRFYRLDPDHGCTAFLSPVYTANGLAFSPNGGTMYFSDSAPSVRTLCSARYDIDTGTPHSVQVFFDTREMPGRPDGGTVDADGCYWMASVGGGELIRLTPAGKIDRVVAMPVEKPTKPMFGGSGLDTIFVTSIGLGANTGGEAGNLFAVTGTGATGVPQVRFQG